MFEFITVTAQYSNAVLVAIMPYFSGFAKQLDLPMRLPITEQQITQFMCDPRQAKVGGWVILTNGYKFWFNEGIVDSFESSECYFHLQDPDQVPKFYGKVNMSRKQAEALAVKSLARLGYPLETCFVEPTPRTSLPERMDAKVIPRYRFEWFDPSSGNRSIDMEVNAESRRIEMLSLSSRNFWRDPPQVQGYDYKKTRSQSARASQVVALTRSNLFILEQIVFPAISDFIGRLGWPVHRPFSTNQLKHVAYRADAKELYLYATNGYRFVFADGYVTAAYTSNVFFNWEAPARIKDYLGEWQMSETEAVKLARNTLVAFGYSRNALGTESNPEIKKPKGTSFTIPRYLITWRKGEAMILESAVAVEVDAQNKRVTSISVFDPQKSKGMPHIELSTDSSRAAMIYRINSHAKSPTEQHVEE